MLRLQQLYIAITIGTIKHQTLHQMTLDIQQIMETNYL